LVLSGVTALLPFGTAASRTLLRVVVALPVAAPPARGARAEAGGLTVTVKRPGAVLVRVPWSPWLGLVDARGDRVAPPRTASVNRHGCLRPAPPAPAAAGTAGTGEDEEPPPTDQWTMLQAPHAGTYRIAAPYEFPRGTACPDADRTGGTRR
jgi:hypothetical protein